METFVDVAHQIQRKKCPDSLTAIELGWLLAVNTGSGSSHTMCSYSQETTFWEVEEKIVADSTLTPEERIILNHFHANHSSNSEGRFLVPLPKQPTVSGLGESRAQAVHRFILFGKLMHAKGQFNRSSMNTS